MSMIRPPGRTRPGREGGIVGAQTGMQERRRNRSMNGMKWSRRGMHGEMDGACEEEARAPGINRYGVIVATRDEG